MWSRFLSLLRWHWKLECLWRFTQMKGEIVVLSESWHLFGWTSLFSSQPRFILFPWGESTGRGGELCGDERSYRNVYAERNGGVGRGKLVTEGTMTTVLISRRDTPAVNRSTRISFQLWGARGSQGHMRRTEFSFYSFPSLQGTHLDTHRHILTSASHPGPLLLLQLGPRAPSLRWSCLTPSPDRCLPLYQLLSESFLVGILSLPSRLSRSLALLLSSGSLPIILSYLLVAFYHF